MGDDINYRKILKEKEICNIGNFEQKNYSDVRLSILYKTNKNNDR